MAATPKIFLLGGGGVPNYGDELIIESWLRWYVRNLHLPADAITVSGSNRRVLHSLFAEAYPGVRLSNAVRSARWQDDTTFYDSIAHGRAYLDDPANADSPLHGELDGTTVFHLHGGGYLNDKWPTHGFLLGLALWAKERLGVRLVGTGLGIGPMEGPAADDALTARAFGAFDVLEVRDSWSLAFLRDSGLHPDAVLGHDDAFLQPLSVRRRKGSTLHLSLRDDKAGGIVCRWLPEQFVESFDHHVFWSCTPQDAGAYTELSKRFPYFELLTNATLLRELPVSEADFMVAQRYHPHLVGARLGMHGVYRSGSEYYDIKHGLVVDMGSPFQPSEMHELKFEPRRWRTSKLAAASHQHVEDKRAFAARLLPGLTPQAADWSGSVGDGPGKRTPARDSLVRRIGRRIRR